MYAREALDPSRSLWHFIAVHLRRYREACGMSGQALATALDCDRSTVSRYESATLKLKPAHAKIIDRLFEADGMFADLIGFAARADEGDWLLSLTEFESRATRIRMWEYAVVPGLLQTQEYARAALMAGVANDLDVDLDRRMSRKAAIFERSDPPRVTAFLSWAALRQLVGTRDIMRGQVAHLVELSELPHVSIRVLENEAGAHQGLEGPFMLLTVDQRDIAYIEATTRGCFLTDPFDVQEIAVRYDSISDRAAPVAPSRAILVAELERLS
ncbi:MULTISPECIES: helix-turn-helix domain-containing protein [Actinomadura]|uniref:helix-turn-helix domain-containing protein n=1 Tax=Actinomadura TaxID=1988 RepID=UPI0009FEA7EE|nr:MULTISPECIES: helix-turn-helix transcriptional regulator [Actinomadura]RSN62302.1 XRE family transcriptional regulator [Actinomadura sp. WAC 06369]